MLWTGLSAEQKIIMLTIFTIPKPFTNPRINIIQRNAIQSWAKILNCEIILCGDDEGVDEIAKEYNILHIPGINRNEKGTPLLNSAFQKTKEICKHDNLCFVNADIILFKDILNVFKYIRTSKQYLIVGQRYDLDVTELINFNNVDWAETLRDKIKKDGKLHPPLGSDYFIFKKDSFTTIPSLAVGRVGWDNWMIYEGRRQKMDVIDATKLITIIHQNHDYHHLKNNGAHRHKDFEAKENIKISEGKSHMFALEDTNWELTTNGLTKKTISWERFKICLKETPEILPGNKYLWKIISRLALKIFFIFKKIS